MKIKHLYIWLIAIVCIMIILYGIKQISDIKHRAICHGHLKGLYTALKVYHTDYHQLPGYESWYDKLISECDFLPEAFGCPADKSEKGMGNYIINKGFDPYWKSSRDVVLVFEGAQGWNQVGDKQHIRFHHFNGCNVLFSDGHVEYIKRKDIDKLKWRNETEPDT